jgi:hypothetical protein
MMVESGKQTTQLLMESSKQQIALLTTLLTAEKQGGGEKESEVDKLRAILDIAKEIKGAPRESEKTLVEQGMELAGQILPPVFNTIQAIMLSRNPNPTTQPQQPTQVTRPMPQNPQPSQQSNQLPPSATNQQPQPNLPNEAIQTITQFTPIILNKLSGEGWEFGAWISEGFGDIIAASIVKHGVDNLLIAAKSVPEFWQKVSTSYGEEYFVKWLTSFVNYKEEMLKDLDNEEVEELEEEKK